MKRVFIVIFSVVLLFTGCYSVEPFSIVESSRSVVLSHDGSSSFSSWSEPSKPAIASSSKPVSSIVSSSKAASKASQTSSAVETDQLDQTRIAVEKKFGIEVLYGDEFTWEYEGMSITELREPSYILQSLELLDTELQRYPNGFCRDLSRKLYIYLITNFTDTYAGLASYQNEDRFELYLTTSPDSIDVLHHEMMHMIDFTMQEKPGFSGFSSWNFLNPPGFIYTGSDYSSNDYVYGVAPVPSDVYFISGYALKEEFEDRAEIFRVVMAHPESVAFFKKVSPVRTKLEYMISEIRRVFPSVQKTEKTAWEIL